MLLNINVKNCQTCHLLSKGFFVLIVLPVAGNHVTDYIFSITVNSSSVIKVEITIYSGVLGLLKDPNLLFKVG